MIMSYEEERLFKSKVTMKYASKGFVESAKEAAKLILESNNIDDIKVLVESIMCEYKVVEEAQKDLDYVKSRYFTTEDENEGLVDSNDDN